MDNEIYAYTHAQTQKIKLVFFYFKLYILKDLLSLSFPTTGDLLP